MTFKIIHETEYEFSHEIFLEPHILRFKPKFTPYNNTLKHALIISPNPIGIKEQLDGENNLVHFCWFEGLHKNLIIKSESLVNAQTQLPFDFIIQPDTYAHVPFTYSNSLLEILAPALHKEPISQGLIAFGKEILKECNAQTIAFISKLTYAIQRTFSVIFREFGAPHHPNKTFLLKEASCRDLAWMQIQLLRNMGFAARFVSGYFFIAAEDPNYELHAWVEVYLPGAGWVGLDPSNGIVTGQSHIPIATSVNFKNTMPVTGTIRGDANSKLTTNLSIEIVN